MASLAMIITCRPATRADAGDDAGRRRAAPILVHAPGGPQAQLEQRRPFVDQGDMRSPRG